MDDTLPKHPLFHKKCFNGRLFNCYPGTTLSLVSLSHTYLVIGKGKYYGGEDGHGPCGAGMQLGLHDRKLVGY